MIGLARLGRDAELRSTTNGDQVATLSLAFNYGKKGSDNRKPSQWVEAALWGARAEALIDYLTKGTTLCVTLEDPHIETYRNRENETVPKLVAKVVSLEFASSPERAPAPPPPVPRATAPAPRPAARTPAPAPRAAPTGFDDMDDDIPF